MPTHGLTTAMTLYRSGTLTLGQAAARAGRTEASFVRALETYGVPLREGDRARPAGASEECAGAD